jgi:hypothetical protein
MGVLGRWTVKSLDNYEVSVDEMCFLACYLPGYVVAGTSMGLTNLFQFVWPYVFNFKVL